MDSLRKILAVAAAAGALWFLEGCMKAGDGMGLDVTGKPVPFCQSNPSHPSCIVVDPCIANPSGPTCQIDSCKKVPPAPGCSVDFCTAHPTDTACIVPVKVKFSEVLPIFKEQCEQCHSPGGAGYSTGRLSLTSDSAYANLVNKPAWVQTVAKGWLRVKPGMPDSSILFLKISMASPKLPDGKAYGAGMPLYKPALPAASVELIRKWIADGAGL